MPKALSEAIMYLATEGDLPTEHSTDGINATTGRIAITRDSNKLWYDDGTFWTDVILTGNLGIGDGALVLRINQLGAPSAAWSNNSKKITDVLNPTLAQDAATKDYVDGSLSALAGTVGPLISGLDSRVDALEADGGGGGSGEPFGVMFTHEGDVLMLEGGKIAVKRY